MDWLSQHLYWANEDRSPVGSIIEVAKLGETTSQRMALVGGAAAAPKDIALHSQAG